MLPRGSQKLRKLALYLPVAGITPGCRESTASKSPSSAHVRRRGFLVAGVATVTKNWWRYHQSMRLDLLFRLPPIAHPNSVPIARSELDTASSTIADVMLM